MKTRLLLILIPAVVLACEAPLKVTTDYDKSVSFDNYSTFSMDSLRQEEQSLSQLNADRIINGIRDAMISKGFKEVTTDPDLRVNAVAIMKNKKEVTANTNYYGYGGVYRPYSWGAGTGGAYTTYDVSDYIDGAVIVDIIDARTNRLVWEAVGNKEIDKPSRDPDTSIREAMFTIMKGFPPGKKK